MVLTSFFYTVKTSFDVIKVKKEKSIRQKKFRTEDHSRLNLCRSVLQR